jgi:hypothetical protein
MKPDVMTQKAMITAKRDGLLRLAFDCELEIMAAEVQVTQPEDVNRVAAYIAELQLKAQNAQAAAERMQEMLTQLSADHA